MSYSRYTEEFKRDAVVQITDRGYSVQEVSERLGVSTKSLYDWRRLYSQSEPKIKKDAAQVSEIHRLKAELARVTEERDILKKQRCTSPKMPNEVRLYKATFGYLQGSINVSYL